MAKYLDYTGLSRVWSKIKEKMTEDNRITLELIDMERAINGFCKIMVRNSPAIIISGHGYTEITQTMVNAYVGDIPHQYIEWVIIGTECTVIGSYAFFNFSGMAAVNIGNNVTRIDMHAFDGCSGLSHVDIPGKVTTIGSNAFLNSGVRTMTVRSITPPEIMGSSLQSNLLAIKVPAESVDTYKTASVWSNYANIISAIS